MTVAVTKTKPKLSKFSVSEPKSFGLRCSLNRRPIYIMAKWKDRLSQDGRISLLVLIPSDVSDEEGVSARLISENLVELNIVWPSILLNSEKLTNSKVSFCKDLDIGNATLLAQGIMDYIEQYQETEGNPLLVVINLKFH